MLPPFYPNQIQSTGWAFFRHFVIFRTTLIGQTVFLFEHVLGISNSKSDDRSPWIFREYIVHQITASLLKALSMLLDSEPSQSELGQHLVGFMFGDAIYSIRVTANKK